MFDSDKRTANSRAYDEAYGVALSTLTRIMLDDNEATEDRIEASEVILANTPHENSKEPVK